MKKYFFVIVLSFALGATCQARIGESPVKCTERYGSPLSTQVIPGGYLCVHRKGDFQVTILFQDGIATVLTIRKWNGRFMPEEIEEIIKANDGERATDTPSKDPQLQMRKSPDGSILYSWNASQGNLVIGFTSFLEKLSAAQKEQKIDEAKASTSGF